MMEQADGRTIQPLTSAGKTAVPPGHAEVVRTPTIWNEQVDEILARMVDERGRRWNIMSGFQRDFTESEYKNRRMFLINLKRLRSGGVTCTPN
jgi:hypothetical protein